MKSSQPAQSQVISIQSIKELLRNQFIQFQSMIVWDLDNTIFQSTQELGSDQWFGHFYQIAKTKLSSSFKFELMLETYNAVQAHVDVMHVEQETIKIIKFLDAMGIKQIFLTARNDGLKKITQRQLEQVGINPTAFLIIYCNGRDKGQMLFENLICSPRHLIMVDDKLENVMHVQKASSRFNIPFIGVHYNFLLEKVKAFDIGYAHFQLSLIQKMLPLQVQQFIQALEIFEDEKPQNEIDAKQNPRTLNM